MTSDSQMERNAHLKKLLVYAVIGVVVVVIYFVYLVISRHQAAREFERRDAEIQRQQHRAEDDLTLKQLGGPGFGIRALYANPPVIRRGESAQVCYDVVNAKTVSLDPPVAEVWPSHTRCFGVSPKRTTTYTLTVTDGTGKTATNDVQVQVH
jgi:hypothetical protein